MLTTEPQSLSLEIVEEHTQKMDEGLADKFHEEGSEYSLMTEWT